MGQRDLPFVTVVIPHKGDDYGLEKCIEALRRQDYPRDKVEILLVINEAEPRDVGFQLEPGEELLFQPEGYSYAARNRGIRFAKGEIVALTDSDTIPCEEWLSEGVKSIGAGADLVAGGIQLTFSAERTTAAGLYERLFAFDQEKNVRLGQSVTANLFASKSAFDKFGYFDPEARSGDDFEWTRAAVKGSAVLVFNPLALVLHPARESLGALLKKTHRTTWHFPKAPSGKSTSKRVFIRALGQLLLPPSASKRDGMGMHHQLAAHLVRATVLFLKALLLGGYFLKQSLARISKLATRRTN